MKEAINMSRDELKVEFANLAESMIELESVNIERFITIARELVKRDVDITKWDIWNLEELKLSIKDMEERWARYTSSQRTVASD